MRLISPLGTPSQADLSVASTGFQRSLLSTELAELFANAPQSPQQNALAAGTVRSTYRATLSREPEYDPFMNAKGAGGLPETRMPEEGDGQSLFAGMGDNTLVRG